MIHTPGSIIFDLDGTLLDTAPDLAAALNLVLKEEGCQSLPLSSVRSLVGRGAVHMIKEGLKQAGMPIDGLKGIVPPFVSTEPLCNRFSRNWS